MQNAAPRGTAARTKEADKAAAARTRGRFLRNRFLFPVAPKSKHKAGRFSVLPCAKSLRTRIQKRT